MSNKNIHSIADAVHAMENSVNYYKCRAAAWDAVKRVYKKDGGSFAVLSKNFTGCRYYTDNAYNARFYVTFRDERGYMETDYINVYKWPEKCLMTADEVAAEIEKTIANYEKWMNTDAAGRDNIAETLAGIAPDLERLKTVLQGCKEYNTQYVVADYIKNYIGIL